MAKKQPTVSILAILSLIFAFVFPLAGLVLGIIALIQINRDSSLTGRGFAWAGIIISSIWIIIALLILLLLVPWLIYTTPTTGF